MHRRRLLPIRQHLCAGGDDAEAGVETTLQVTPTPPHLLDRISPIFSPFFPVFCACSPSRRGGSNEPQAGTQGRETAGAGAQTAGNTVLPVGLTPGVRNAWQRTGVVGVMFAQWAVHPSILAEIHTEFRHAVTAAYADEA